MHDRRARHAHGVNGEERLKAPIGCACSFYSRPILFLCPQALRSFPLRLYCPPPPLALAPASSLPPPQPSVQPPRAPRARVDQVQRAYYLDDHVQVPEGTFERGPAVEPRGGKK